MFQKEMISDSEAKQTVYSHHKSWDTSKGKAA